MHWQEVLDSLAGEYIVKGKHMGTAFTYDTFPSKTSLHHFIECSRDKNSFKHLDRY